MPTGTLHKMRVIGVAPVAYSLIIGESATQLNPLIGKRIALRFTGNIKCVACGRDIKKTFQQGYCFPCTQKLAEADFCIVKPELCHHHAGTCRDDTFAQAHCFIPHVVYLAVSSGAKVGITRAHQKFTRWADQGATQAIDFAIVPDRRTAGLLEVELAKHLADKTNWRLMLSGQAEPVDLVALKNNLRSKTPEMFQKYLSEDDTMTEISYPVDAYPAKINSYNFDKNPLIDDVLDGIKGQYLIFRHGVINVRKFQGYEIEME